MMFWHIRKQLSFYLLFLSSLGVLHGAQQEATPAAASVPFANATVADFKSKVQVQLPGQAFTAPALGQVLPPESEIQTDKGQMLLRLEDGSEILVHPHTHLVLKQPIATTWQRLELMLGRIKAEIQKRVSGAPPFQIGTPSAVISVRGTRFYAEVDKQNTTEVDVEEGEVQLESANHIGAPVMIKAGSSSRVGENSAPEPAQPTKQLQKQSGKSGGNGPGNGGNNGHGGQGNGMGHTPHTPPPTSRGGGQR